MIKKISLSVLLMISIIISVSFNKENETRVCIATWYNSHGKNTASNIRMHKDSATAAYNGYPLRTKLLITNLTNNKKCVVLVTDRMGLKTHNRIDLSYKAFGLIGKRSDGVLKVKIQKIN